MVGKVVLSVWKGHRPEESEIKVHCSWFPYFRTLQLTYKKCVTELNRAVHASRTKSKVGNILCQYLILHDSLLNHMTTITKVGVSYIDHTNDDAPACSQQLEMCSGSFLRRETRKKASMEYCMYVTGNNIYTQFYYHCIVLNF